MAVIYEVDDATQGLTPQNGAGFEPGLFGNAARVAGGSQELTCAFADCPEALFPGGAMIWWSWVRRDMVEGNDRPLDAQTQFSAETGSGFSLQLRALSRPENNLDFAAYMGGIRRAQTLEPYPLGEWHLLTAVYRPDWDTEDPSFPAGGLVRVFIDGEDRTADTVCVKDPLASPLRCIDWGSEPFDLPVPTRNAGRISLGHGGRFNGAIDRTGIGYGVFTSAEVGLLHACELEG